MIATVGFELDGSSGRDRDAGGRRTHFHDRRPSSSSGGTRPASAWGDEPPMSTSGSLPWFMIVRYAAAGLGAGRRRARPWLHDHDGARGVGVAVRSRSHEGHHGSWRLCSWRRVGPADLVSRAALDRREVERTGLRGKLHEQTELVGFVRREPPLPCDRGHARRPPAPHSRSSRAFPADSSTATPSGICTRRAVVGEAPQPRSTLKNAAKLTPASKLVCDKAICAVAGAATSRLRAALTARTSETASHGPAACQSVHIARFHSPNAPECLDP